MFMWTNLTSIPKYTLRMNNLIIRRDLGSCVILLPPSENLRNKLEHFHLQKITSNRKKNGTIVLTEQFQEKAFTCYCVDIV